MGTVDGVNGDHIIISPSYNINDADVDAIVDRVGRLIEDYFEDVKIETLDLLSTPSAP